MIFNILKKDLKRKKTMNIILLLFIILATMFVSSGLGNIISVVNGTEYYLEKADIGDYVIITQRDVSNLFEILDNEPAVNSYKYENVIFGSKGDLKSGDKKLEIKNTLIIQSIDDAKINYYDKNNEIINDIPRGCVYVSGKFFEKNEMNKNENQDVTLSLQNIELEVKVIGKAKDALLGSDFMGNTRILMNDEDFKIFSESKSLEEYKGNIFYINSDDTKAVSSCLSEANNILFDGDRALIKMCYVMDMIVAFVIVVLSICLILVSFVILKFTISFTITEEYREIGVMKAIGITNTKIRSLYLVKYLALAILGAIIGFVASIPFEKMLIKSVSENMVLGSSGGIYINVIGVAIVILIIIFFAYACTRKVKKSTPVDAIRSGQTGERYKKKSVYRIGKSHVSTKLYMAINDVISSPRRFLAIMISFFLCSVFTLGLVIVTETMKSKSLIDTFCQESDVYITDIEEIMKNWNNDGREGMIERLEKIEEICSEENMPCETSIELQFKYKVMFDGKSYNISCQQGMITLAANYKYIEGTAPVNDNEVAITKQISEKIGAKIGDEIIIDFAEGQRKYVVTAYFQTMNQMGEIIRLNENAPTNFTNISSAMAFQLNFTDNPSEKEIKDRIERLKIIFDNEDIYTAAEYCADCIGVVDTMEAVQYLLLTITIIVVILVTILLERTFISDEKGQIALLKAMGFTDGAIIRWHVYRFGIVAIIVEILSVILAKPITKLWCDPIFGMLGASEIDYYINPMKTFIMYPGIIFLVTIGTAWITSLYTKKIKCADTANIE